MRPESPHARGHGADAREGRAAARLALAEALLASDGPVECAQATVDWLGVRAGARRALCALFDAENGKASVVSSGVPRAQVDGFALALDEPGHPLVFALAGQEAVELRNSRRPGHPFRGDVLAIPLPLTDKREARLGLLLVPPSHAGEARWAAELLGQKLARLRAQRSAVAGGPTVVTTLRGRTETLEALEKAQLYEQLKSASEQLEEKVREATAELVRRNELLQRQHLELQQALLAKSQFLANVSHEFRTPLNAILGYTSILLAGVSGEMPPPQKVKVARVDSNAKHLLSMINDILDISRMEAGRMPLHAEEFELPALLEELLAEVGPLVQKARLSAALELPQGLPALFSDRQKVKQIVLNFLTNAIKFTPQGNIKVSVACDQHRREMRISVADTGIGIAPRDFEKVFEDFRQADDSVTREYGGAGLGLAICRRLANMLDGRIELDSGPGRGSTFTLVIPRKGKRR